MKVPPNKTEPFNKQSGTKPSKVVTATPTSQASSSALPNGELVHKPDPFGAYAGGVYTFPNDGIQLDIYNDQDFYYETIPTATEYTIDGTVALVDLEKELQNAGYQSGDFRVQTRLLRNYLGTASSLKLIVQEVSADRLEIRVIPAQLADDGTPEGIQRAIDINAGFTRFFANGFFGLDKQMVLSNLYAFINPTTSIAINDYIQDKFTVQSYPYSIIFKLQQPLTPSTGVGSLIWIAQEANPPVIENVIVYPQQELGRYTKIKGPNFDVLRKATLTTNTEYQSWDDILASNPRQLTRTVLSQSLVEGIELNVDYTRFENFAKFSSVDERIKNFEYKVKLIENYQGVSASLATSTASQSFYVQNQMTSTLDKIDAVIGAFDGFEKYMYFESSSYVSNSFGEFLDVAWPKSTTSRPYALYGSSTTIVQDWLAGIGASASFYDDNNQYSLRRLVPQHIQEQNSVVVDSFVNMLGHFFDVQYEYINQMPKIHDRQEKLTEGFAKELVYSIAQNLGVDFSNGDNFQDLWSYTLGLNASGSYDNALELSGEDRTREIWKRIVNNLPLLLKTKGTERGIRALINCYGIPSTILRIREYGGPEVDFNKQSTYNHDRFYYALTIGSGSGYLNINWGDTGSLFSKKVPRSLEFRFKAQNAYNALSTGSVRLAHLRVESSTFGIPAGTITTHINAGRDSKGDFVELFLTGSTSSSRAYLSGSSNTKLFDGSWVTVLVNYSGIGIGSSTTSSFDLFIGQKANYSETPIIASASIFQQTTNVLDARAWAYDAQTLQFGTGSTYNGKTTSSFSGSLQEVRLWNDIKIVLQGASQSLLCVTGGLNLEQSPFYAHVISPTTIVGSNYEDASWTGATSSYADLVFRLPLGTDNKKINLNATSSLSGSQPNFNYNTRSGSFVNFNANTSSYWTPIVEENYMPWPDISGNRAISNKIRLEQTVNSSRELYRNVQTQKSLQDDQPIDSPRLGIFLAPTDEINKDIAEQFGGISLDDYIGSYNEIYSNYYEDLAHIRAEYTKKNPAAYTIQSYVRLLQHFNGSLFSIIKQMVPYRANLQTGLVIEPHILSRSKVKTASRPITENEGYDITLDMPSVDELAGDVSNLTGSLDTTIQTIIIGDHVLVPSGSVGTKIVNISAKQNEYNRGQVEAQGRRLARLNSTASYEDVIFTRSALEDTVELNVTSYGKDKLLGSQYRFPSPVYIGTASYAGLTASSAGFVTIDSIGEDYWNPIATDATRQRASEIFQPTEVPYNSVDFFNGTGSFNTDPANTIYTGSYFNTALGRFGFRFTSTPTSYFTEFSPAPVIEGIGSLEYVVPPSLVATGSVSVPVFYYNGFPTALYQIKLKVRYHIDTGIPQNLNIILGFGGTGSAYTQQITTTNTATEYVYFSRADGPYLTISMQTSQSSANGANYQIDSLTVVPYINTEIQDYQVGPLASIGQRNQKYDGCKLTAADFNEDSPDTIDGGPVIEIITGPGANIAVNPSTTSNKVVRDGFKPATPPTSSPRNTRLGG